MGIIEKIVVSDAVLRRLQEEADRHGKTVEQEAAERLEGGVAGESDETIDYVAWAQRIRAMTPKGIVQTDSVRLIRDDRDHGHSIDRR
jgi:hypothetical protein